MTLALNIIFRFTFQLISARVRVDAARVLAYERYTPFSDNLLRAIGWLDIELFKALTRAPLYTHFHLRRPHPIPEPTVQASGKVNETEQKKCLFSFT